MADLTPKKPSVSRVLVAAIMAVLLLSIGVGIVFMAKSQAVTQNVVIDKETSSIVITRKTGEGIDTRRVRFDDVDKVEYVVGGFAATWSVYAILKNDERLLIRSTSDQDLTEYAQHVASIMNKPLLEERKVSGMREGLPEAQLPGQDQEKDTKKTKKDKQRQ